MKLRKKTPQVGMTGNTECFVTQNLLSEIAALSYIISVNYDTFDALCRNNSNDLCE